MNGWTTLTSSTAGPQTGQLTRNSAVTAKPPNACCISYYVLPSGEVKWRSSFYFTSPEGNTDAHGIQSIAYLRHSVWRPQWGESPRAIGFIFGVGKLEWLGYNLVKVAWWSTQSFGHSTSTWQSLNHVTIAIWRLQKCLNSKTVNNQLP